MTSSPTDKKASQSGLTTKKLALLAMFAALSLGIYALEAMLPSPIPIPGVKLGLSNIIALVVLKKYGFRETVLVVIVRILLSALLFGSLSSLIYSAAGATLCLIAEFITDKLIRGRALYITAVFGALFHNAGQLAVSLVLTGSTAVLVYLPYLAIAAILTGLFTGLCAHFMLRLIPHAERE